MNKSIHSQAHYACRKIQAIIRGYLTRKRLRSYGGIFFENYVIKIQCMWRQRMAIKRFISLYEAKLKFHAHKIHNMYYFWKSKKLRQLIHATYHRKCIVKIQSYYRMHLAKRVLKILKELHRIRLISRIQACIRRFLACKKVKERARMLKIVNGFSSFTLPLLEIPSEFNNYLFFEYHLNNQHHANHSKSLSLFSKDPNQYSIHNNQNKELNSFSTSTYTLVPDPQINNFYLYKNPDYHNISIEGESITSSANKKKNKYNKQTLKIITNLNFFNNNKKLTYFIKHFYNIMLKGEYYTTLQNVKKLIFSRVSEQFSHFRVAILHANLQNRKWINNQNELKLKITPLYNNFDMTYIKYYFFHLMFCNNFLLNDENIIKSRNKDKNFLFNIKKEITKYVPMCNCKNKNLCQCIKKDKFYYYNYDIYKLYYNPTSFSTSILPYEKFSLIANNSGKIKLPKNYLKLYNELSTFLIFLSFSSSWAKYGIEKQLNLSLLERVLGIMSFKIEGINSIKNYIKTCEENSKIKKKLKKKLEMLEKQKLNDNNFTNSNSNTSIISTISDNPTLPKRRLSRTYEVDRISNSIDIADEIGITHDGTDKLEKEEEEREKERQKMEENQIKGMEKQVNQMVNILKSLISTSSANNIDDNVASSSYNNIQSSNDNVENNENIVTNLDDDEYNNFVTDLDDLEFIDLDEDQEHNDLLDKDKSEEIIGGLFNKEEIKNIIFNKKIVEEEILFENFRYNSLNFDQIFDCFFQLSSLPNYSKLRLFDAFLLKFDVLFYMTLNLSDGKLMLNLKNALNYKLPLFYTDNTDDRYIFDSNYKKSNIDSDNRFDSYLITDNRPGSALTRPGSALTRPGSALTRPGSALIRPGSALGRPGSALGRPGSALGSYSGSRPGTTSNFTMDYKYNVNNNITGSNPSNLESSSATSLNRLNIILQRMIRLLDRARSLTISGSPEELEITHRQDLFVGLNLPPQLLHSHIKSVSVNLDAASYFHVPMHAIQQELFFNDKSNFDNQDSFTNKSLDNDSSSNSNLPPFTIWDSIITDTLSEFFDGDIDDPVMESNSVLKRIISEMMTHIVSLRTLKNFKYNKKKDLKGNGIKSIIKLLKILLFQAHQYYILLIKKNFNYYNNLANQKLNFGRNSQDINYFVPSILISSLINLFYPPNTFKVSIKFPLLSRIILVGTVLVVQGEIKSENEFHLSPYNDESEYNDDSIISTPSKKSNMKILSSLTSNEIKEEDDDEDEDENEKKDNVFLSDQNNYENEQDEDNDFLPFDSNGHLRENEKIYDIDINDLIYHFKNAFKKILDEKILKYLKLFFKQQFYISPFSSSILPDNLQNDYFNTLKNFINKEAVFSNADNSDSFYTESDNKFNDINSINKNKFNLPSKSLIIRPLLLFSHELQYLVKSQNLHRDSNNNNNTNNNNYSNKLKNSNGIKILKSGLGSTNSRNKFEFDSKNPGIKQLVRRHNMDFSLFLDFIYSELDVSSSCFEVVDQAASNSNNNSPRINKPISISPLNSPLTRQNKRLSLIGSSPNTLSPNTSFSLSSSFSFPLPPFLPPSQTPNSILTVPNTSPYSSPLLASKPSMRKSLLKTSIFNSSATNNSNSIINANQISFPFNFLPNYSTNLASKFLTSDPTIEPIFNLFLMPLHKRRSYFLSSNSLNFACILIQRIYRGYYTRLKIKYFLENYSKYQLKLALGFYGYKKWIKFHNNYIKKIIKIQSFYLKYKYQKLYKLKLFYISRIQRNFKIFLLKLRIRKKYNKKYNKNKIIYMLDAPREILLNKKKIKIWVFRCGNNYRIDGIDLEDNNYYHGVIYENELKNLINNYNKQIFANEIEKIGKTNKLLAESLQVESDLIENNDSLQNNNSNSLLIINSGTQNDSLRSIFNSVSKNSGIKSIESKVNNSSMVAYSKNLIEKKYLKLWQYEKICDFLIENLTFIRGINIPTKDLQRVYLPYLPLNADDKYYKILDENQGEKEAIKSFVSPIQDNITFDLNKNSNLQFIIKLKSSSNSFLSNVFNKTPHNLTTKNYHENYKNTIPNSLRIVDKLDPSIAPLPDLTLPLPLNDDITKHPYIKYLQRDLKETVESKKTTKKIQINKLLKDFNSKKNFSSSTSSISNKLNTSSQPNMANSISFDNTSYTPLLNPSSSNSKDLPLIDKDVKNTDEKKEKYIKNNESNILKNQNFVLNNFLIPKFN